MDAAMDAAAEGLSTEANASAIDVAGNQRLLIEDVIDFMGEVEKTGAPDSSGYIELMFYAALNRGVTLDAVAASGKPRLMNKWSALKSAVAQKLGIEMTVGEAHVETAADDVIDPITVLAALTPEACVAAITERVASFDGLKQFMELNPASIDAAAHMGPALILNASVDCDVGIPLCAPEIFQRS